MSYSKLNKLDAIVTSAAEPVLYITVGIVSFPRFAILLSATSPVAGTLAGKMSLFETGSIIRTHYNFTTSFSRFIVIVSSADLSFS